MQNRFSRSELKVMQLAVFTICVGFVMFFVTAKTLLLPAFRSSYFVPTTCQITGERLVKRQGSKDKKLFAECANKEYVDYPCKQILIQYDFPFLQATSTDEDEYFDEEESYEAANNKSVTREKTHRKHWLEGFEQKLKLQQNAVLFMSDIDLLYDDGCSYHPHCSRDQDVMLREVALYHGRVRFPGTSFACFYDPKKPAITVMYVTFTKMSIFHSLFWPFSFVFLGCFILFVVYFCIGKLKKNCIKPKQKKDGR